MKVRDLNLEFFYPKLPKLSDLIIQHWKFEPIQEEDIGKQRKMSIHSSKIKVDPKLPDMSLKEAAKLYTLTFEGDTKGMVRVKIQDISLKMNLNSKSSVTDEI